LQFTPTRKPYFGSTVKRGLLVIKIGSQKKKIGSTLKIRCSLDILLLVFCRLRRKGIEKQTPISKNVFHKRIQYIYSGILQKNNEGMREFNVCPLCIHFNGTFVVTMGSHLIVFVVNQLDAFKSEFFFL